MISRVRVLLTSGFFFSIEDEHEHEDGRLDATAEFGNLCSELR
jgi:hypothetical protein